MTRVLFVCLGNICRSPTAEGVFRRMVKERGLSDQIEIDSAGTGDWHVGQLPDPRMREHAAKRGYELTMRARQLSRADFQRFDWIVVMDASNLANARALAPAEPKARLVEMTTFCRHHDLREVPDPYYGDAKGFETVLDILEDACQGLLDEIISGSSST